MKESLEEKKNKNVKKGISLIVLVITIIVIVILAVAVILSIANNNPISNANKASFQNDIKTMQEELELTKASNYANSKGQSYGTINFNDLTGSSKYTNKFKIKNGELVYTTGLTGDELKWAKELGISSSVYELGSSDNDGVQIDTNIFEINNRENFENILRENDGEIAIPEGVTTIKNYTFEGYEDLKNVVVPSTLTTIGDGAFQGSGITSIEIPESVTTIGDSAFYGCSALESIEIPEGVTTIESNTFEGCNNLVSVSLPSTLTAIKLGAFMDCSNLKNLVLPEGIKKIEGYALGGLALTEITIPDSIENLDESAFVPAYGGPGVNLTVKISEETARKLFDFEDEEDLAINHLMVGKVEFK